MRATGIEKAELDSYRLKDFAQAWYATFLVLNTRDEMSRFLTGISEELEEYCRAAMLHDRMDFSRLMVHVQQVEDSQKKRRARKPRFKKGHQSAGNSNCKRSASHKRGRPKTKKGNGGNVQRPRKECGKCGGIHSGECRLGTNASFGCGMSGHMVRDCPQNRGQARGNAQPMPNRQNATAVEPRKRNIFYSLKGREELEKSADVVIDLTRKKAKFKWAETCEKNFKQLKDRLTSSPSAYIT
ncbi:uncharacterized protein LOC107001193 [Solanum pennellii]|uniref:Uncharacterized protein LOC107001193 n=1 Tax=Solanum pennellii TaxID=28526 RepID=A0ABM1FCC9_SOLPN|nr:uncharacterized protein LOC107001193 [Solanum pennellii]